MSPTRTLACVAAALALGGCIVQGGAHAGRTWHEREDVAHQWTWGGHLQSQLALGGPVARLHVAAELEGRAEHQRGSFLTWGPQLGVEVAITRKLRLLPHLDVGWPTGWKDGATGYHVGATLEVPIVTSDLYGPSQVNRDYRFTAVEGALVPYVRLRTFQLDLGGADQGTAYEVVTGVAFRTELVTDIL